MAKRDEPTAATLYFIAGVRRALDEIDHNPRTLRDIAEMLELMAPGHDEAAIRTAARWMRSLGPEHREPAH